MSHLNTVCVCAFVCVDTGIHTSEHVDESHQTTLLFEIPSIVLLLKTPGNLARGSPVSSSHLHTGALELQMIMLICLISMWGLYIQNQVLAESK